MIHITDKTACCGCTACVSACPVRCIDLVTDEEGFWYPEVNRSACVGCGRCESVCPFLSARDKAPVLSTYAARTEDEMILSTSSSGGVFAELCKLSFADGGVVYGVAMQDDCRGCVFVRAEEISGTISMRGSKYLQADCKGVYDLVSADLRSGRKVLFVGTPCQANALVSYLGTSREGLTVIDFICHGVPSPKLWAAFVDHLERKHGSRVANVSFRRKEAVIRDNRGRLALDADQEYQPLSLSPYLRMFLRNYCLRPSCYSCRAKRTRYADATIADFWGVKEVVPQMASEMGCSLVIVRTEQALRHLDRMGASITLAEVDYDDAVRWNPSAFESTKRPPERDVFFSDLDRLDFSEIVRKYGSLHGSERLKSVIVDRLNRLGLLGLARHVMGKGPSKSLRYGILIEYESTLK